MVIGGVGGLMYSINPVYVEVRMKILETRVFVTLFLKTTFMEKYSVCGCLSFDDFSVSFVAHFPRGDISLQTMKKRFFILRSDSSEASARLEYYEDEKKWKKNHCPRRYSRLP